MWFCWLWATECPLIEKLLVLPTYLKKVKVPTISLLYVKVKIPIQIAQVNGVLQNIKKK